MKRFLKLLPCIALAVLLACIALQPTKAHAATIGDLTFTLNSDGQSYSVSDCKTSATGELTIPATYKGLPVTTIGNSAFYYCEKLTSVTIPDGVTTIEICAFDHCRSLTSVTIPDSVTTIEICAFCHCEALTSVTIPDSVTTIGACAFQHCYSLTTVTIPGSVTTIGGGAFGECHNLTSVIIPDSVTTISSGAFECCYSLTNVTIPGSITSIDADAFMGAGLTSVTIPDSVSTIGEGAFQMCVNLTSVTIGNSVTSIGHMAFQFCDSLTTVTIPDSVTTIGEYVFYVCPSLTDVYYCGTQEQWDAVAIAGNNTSLEKAILHFGDPCADGHSFGEDEICDICSYTKLTADAITLDSANKLTVTDEEATHTNHRATVYFLGENTVEDIADEAALKAIDADAKTHWGLTSINKVQLLESGNYVVLLHYNVGTGAKQTVAKAFTVSIAKPVIEMNEHKVVVTAGGDICANYRATVYALDDATVADIYDEAALKAIDADAKTHWGLTAINKLQLPENGNYVIHLHYNVGTGAKQTVAKAVTIDNGEPTLQVENGKLIATDPENAYIHHRAEVYYLGEETAIENAVSTKTYWGLNSINNAKLTQPGNYVILYHYNLAGSVKMTVTLQTVI